MPKTYSLTIAGCTRELPICEVTDTLDIAALIMFGDVELTEKSASALLKKCPKFDVLVTPEAKSIPLCYEMAKQSGKHYIVARKFLKVYITNPISVEVKSITTGNMQKLHFSETDAEFLKGKKVLIVDDVISTGGSVSALEALVSKAGGIIAGKAFVLAEGDANKRDDIIFLESLPLFSKK